MDETENTYSTTDFYTAALLVSLEYEILEVTREGKPDRDGKGRTRRLHFSNSSTLQEDIMEYMNNKKEGKLRDFRDAIETIKDLVHS